MDIIVIQAVFIVLGPISFGLSWVIIRACRNLIQNYILTAGNLLLNTKIAEIERNPEVFDPIIGKILGRFATKTPGGGGSLNIMGFKVPPMLQPIVEQVLSAAAKKFLPEIAGEAQNAAGPFG